MTLDCGDRDRDSYGDDTMMGRVLLLTTWATTSQLRPAETRIPERAPGTRQQTAKCSNTPDT